MVIIILIRKLPVIYWNLEHQSMDWSYTKHSKGMNKDMKLGFELSPCSHPSNAGNREAYSNLCLLTTLYILV